MSQGKRAEGAGRVENRTHETDTAATAQREGDTEEGGETYSTEWREHGVIALVLLGRHTDVRKEAAEKGMLGK